MMRNLMRIVRRLFHALVDLLTVRRDYDDLYIRLVEDR